MTTGKELITTWAHQCLGKRLTIGEDSETYAGILSTEWKDLMERVDMAIREAKQEGLDYRKSKKLLTDNSEHGPFWQQFYLRGVMEMPGVKEALDLDGVEDQWSEAIRIRFKKPTLRAVDPNELINFLDWLSTSMAYDFDAKNMTLAADRCREIINGMGSDAAGEINGQKWSIAQLKGK